MTPEERIEELERRLAAVSSIVADFLRAVSVRGNSVEYAAEYAERRMAEEGM